MKALALLAKLVLVMAAVLIWLVGAVFLLIATACFPFDEVRDGRGVKFLVAGIVVPVVGLALVLLLARWRKAGRVRAL